MEPLSHQQIIDALQSNHDAWDPPTLHSQHFETHKVLPCICAVYTDILRSGAKTASQPPLPNSAIYEMHKNPDLDYRKGDEEFECIVDDIMNFGDLFRYWLVNKEEQSFIPLPKFEDLASIEIWLRADLLVNGPLLAKYLDEHTSEHITIMCAPETPQDQCDVPVPLQEAIHAINRMGHESVH